MSKNPKRAQYAKVRGIDLDRDSIVQHGIIGQSGPAMLLDGGLEFLPMTANGASFTSFCHLPENSHVFSGHFPGRPVCPAHYLLQMSYLTSLLFRFCQTGEKIGVYRPFSVGELTNRAPVMPGDSLHITCFNPVEDQESFGCSVAITNQAGKTVATIEELSFALEEFDPEKNQAPLGPMKTYNYLTRHGQVLSAMEATDSFPLPHRGHALMINGVTGFAQESDFSVIDAVHDLQQMDICFSGSRYCQGHFMLEMAYLTAALFNFCLTGESKSAPAPYRTRGMSFLRPALPGETLRITCYEPAISRRSFECTATITDGNNHPVANISRIYGISLK